LTPASIQNVQASPKQSAQNTQSGQGNNPTPAESSPIPPASPTPQIPPRPGFVQQIVDVVRNLIP